MTILQASNSKNKRTVTSSKNTKAKSLLEILSDGNAHSGADLGEQLGITRSAVWKLINQLKEEVGIKINAKTNQGYQIQENYELLDLRKIKSFMDKRNHQYMAKSIILDEVSSSNTYLLEMAKEPKTRVNVCLAEVQTACRGKLNRRWFTTFGNNIAFSILWHFYQDIPQLSGLSLTIAVAIMRALRRCNIYEDIGIKWPNDIFWKDRKLSGVLIDLCGEYNYNCDAIIGVGMNMHIPETLRKGLDFKLADLAEISDKIPGRNQLMGYLLDELFDALTVFQHEGLLPFLLEFIQADITLNKSVKILYANDVYEGVGRGIDDQGHFLLEDKLGKIRKFLSGEASLRM